MKLGFHGATTMTSDLETDVAVTAAAGYGALEVVATKIDAFLKTHTLADLKTLFVSHGVQPLTINALEFVGFRGSDYPRVQTRCHELCRMAQAMDCPAIVTVPSPTPDRTTLWSDVVDEYVRVLRDLSAIAADYGIRLAFEFLGFGWCSVRTPRGCWEIVHKVDRANVGMNFDAAHFYTGGGLLSEIDALDPAKIYTFHLDDVDDIPKEAITDNTRLMPGLGVIPLDDICVRLKTIGYDGNCSIELFRPEYWQMDPSEVASKCRRLALNVLMPHFHVE